MAVIYQQGESFADLQNKYSPESREDDVGFFESALAGVATGLWNIPKGFVSLGAELFDLVGDTDTARDVEQWFDDVNPFDDEAEARTVGKITQALTQIAPLAVIKKSPSASLSNPAVNLVSLAKPALTGIAMSFLPPPGCILNSVVV